MKTSNSALRFFGRLASALILATAMLGASGCMLTASQAPSTQAVAQVGGTTAPAAAPVPAAAPAPVQAGGATSAAGAAAPGPSAALGKQVVSQSCIGRCHDSGLLGYRTSASGAQRIASSMGRRTGLDADKQQAIALFFAQ